MGGPAREIFIGSSGERRGLLTFQSSSFHQLGLFLRESRYEMFRKRVMPGVLAEALIKWIAASRSTANVCVKTWSCQFLFVCHDCSML